MISSHAVVSASAAWTTQARAPRGAGRGLEHDRARQVPELLEVPAHLLEPVDDDLCEPLRGLPLAQSQRLVAACVVGVEGMHEIGGELRHLHPKHTVAGD